MFREISTIKSQLHNLNKIFIINYHNLKKFNLKILYRFHDFTILISELIHTIVLLYMYWLMFTSHCMTFPGTYLKKYYRVPRIHIRFESSHFLLTLVISNQKIHKHHQNPVTFHQTSRQLSIKFLDHTFHGFPEETSEQLYFLQKNNKELITFINDQFKFTKVTQSIICFLRKILTMSGYMA